MLNVCPVALYVEDLVGMIPCLISCSTAATRKFCVRCPTISTCLACRSAQVPSVTSSASTPSIRTATRQPHSTTNGSPSTTSSTANAMCRRPTPVSRVHSVSSLAIGCPALTSVAKCHEFPTHKTDPITFRWPPNLWCCPRSRWTTKHMNILIAVLVSGLS